MYNIIKIKETEKIYDIRTTLFQYTDKNGILIFIVCYTVYGSYSCCDADIALEEKIYKLTLQEKKEVLVENITKKLMTMNFFVSKKEALQCFNKKW